MNNDKIILLKSNYYRIFEFIIFIILMSYVIIILANSHPPLWFYILMIIFFGRYIQSSFSCSNLIYIDQKLLVFHFNIFNSNVKSFSLDNIDKIVYHRGNGRLDENSILLYFKNGANKKYISFAGGEKECNKLVEGLKNEGISITIN